MKALGGKRSVGRKLVHGSALRMANLFVAALSALVTMPLIVHHLGDRTYGFWALASAFIGYYELLDLGLTSAISQYICIAIGRQDKEECHAVFNTALRIMSLVGVAALAVTAVIAFVTPWFCKTASEASVFRSVIIILGANAAFVFPTRVYSGLLEAELRFDIQAGINLLSLVLRTAGTIWAMYSGLGLLALAWVFFVAQGLGMALQVYFAHRAVSWARISSGSLSWTRTKEFFSYSAFTSGASLADLLRFQVDALVISSFVGLGAVTHYRIASVFAKYFMDTLLAIVRLFQPIFSRLFGAGDRKGLDKAFYFATKIGLCASVFICFASIAWGKPFIVRWMGPGYKDAYWPMVVLLIAVFLDVCQTPSITLLYAIFKHRYYMYTNLAEGILNLIVSLILVRPLGILGVALGTLIAAVVVRVLIQPVLVCRVADLSLREYTTSLGKDTARFGGLMGLTILVSAWGLRPNYLWIVSSAICATVIYAAGSLWGVFDVTERKQLLSAIVGRS